MTAQISIFWTRRFGATPMKMARFGQGPAPKRLRSGSRPAHCSGRQLALVAIGHAVAVGIAVVLVGHAVAIIVAVRTRARRRCCRRSRCWCRPGPAPWCRPDSQRHCCTSRKGNRCCKPRQGNRCCRSRRDNRCRRRWSGNRSNSTHPPSSRRSGRPSSSNLMLTHIDLQWGKISHATG